MDKKLIWQSVELELRKIKKEHTNFPDHICAMAGMVTNEAGKMMDLAIKEKYKHDPENKLILNNQYLINSAVRTAAMAIRFLENINV
jgi:hypothetical protein